MNRVKVLLFALLVVAGAAAALRAHGVRLRAAELASLDARLAAAAGQIAGAARALAREAGAVATVAGANERLVAALAATEVAPLRGRRAPADPAAEDAEVQDAGRGALASAQRLLGFDLPAGTALVAASRATLARAEGKGEGEAEALLRGAVEGAAARRLVRIDGALFQAAASPAGPGAGLVVLVPVDGAWARTAGEAAGGVDLTIVAPEVKPVSTAGGADAASLAAWSAPAGVAMGVGRLGAVDLSLGPVALPRVSSLLGELPARRARGVALDGVEGGLAVVSLPAVRPLAQVVAFEWYAVAGLGAVLFLGLVFAALVRPAGDGPAPVPEELVSAAARIEKGDFAARAPALAGKLGTVAAALNRAAELAGPAAAAATARPSLAEEPFTGLRPPESARPEPTPALPEAPAAFALAPPPAPAEDPFQGPSLLGGQGPLDAVAAPPRAEPPPPPPEPAPVAPAAELLQAAAQAAPPVPTPGADGEEPHWRQVFEDFLRTRASCGEATEGLSYERFRAKLESNRATLVAKYSCKTVKFQVYVKEGKTALRATPVR